MDIPTVYRDVIRATEHGPRALYLLPGGEPVWIDDTAAKGLNVIGFTLRGGEIVNAYRAKVDAAGIVAASPGVK
jgi:hypothetical protein